jgi:hypothetical protein
MAINEGRHSARELILLDNDFFGQPDSEAKISEIKAGKYKVSFNQIQSLLFFLLPALRL